MLYVNILKLSSGRNFFLDVALRFELKNQEIEQSISF